MMRRRGELERQLDQHRYLTCVVCGDTLWIQPVGSLMGSDSRLFYSELNRIKTAFRTGEFQNAVIDLSTTRYYGSEMIGVMFDLGKQVLENGKVIVAEPSPDTRFVLEKMNMEKLFPIRDSTQAAIREISSESLLSRLQRSSFRGLVYTGCAIAVLLVLLGTFTTQLNRWTGTRESKRFQRVVVVYEELIDALGQHELQSAWSEFSQRASQQITPILQEVSGIRSKTRTHDMLESALMTMDQLLKSPAPPQPQDAALLQSQLNDVSREIAAKHGVYLKVPRVPAELYAKYRQRQESQSDEEAAAQREADIANRMQLAVEADVSRDENETITNE